MSNAERVLAAIGPISRREEKEQGFSAASTTSCARRAGTTVGPTHDEKTENSRKIAVGKEKGFRLERRKPFDFYVLNWLRGPATPQRRHALILPYRFELTRAVAA